MIKPTRVKVKLLKKMITSSILQRIKTTGYKLLLEREVHECTCISDRLCTCGSYRPEIMIVDIDTQYIPVIWHAGIDGRFDFKFGEDLTRIEFASEEAKRKVREIYPGCEDFITWAWYN